MSEAPSPKDRFTALDTLALVRELRALGPAHIDKAFDLPGGGWSVAIRAAGQGRRELVLVPGRFAALVEERMTHEEGLSPIARELRRLLGGATLVGATEPRSERYLEITLRRPDAESLVLALEFFGAGNLVIARDTKIAAVSRPRAWAHRVVRVGADYQRPPERRNPWGMGPAELENELHRSRTDLTSTLAARLALGGPIAEELLCRAGLSGGGGPFPSGTGAALHEAIRTLLDEVGDPPAGFLYERDTVVVDATPYRSKRWAADPSVVEREVPRFSEAAMRYFASTAPSLPAETAPPDPERDLLERQRDRQRTAVESLEEAAAARVAGGQAILSHFAEAERQILAARQGAEPPERITIELGGTAVELMVARPPRASAQRLFEEAKRLQGKAAGARTALAETEARLERHSASTTARPESVAPAKTTRPRAARWYSRFRWFLSSDGLIVVAGRDAASNDHVVRRHLGDRDLYLHADIHGAASVVVKAPERTTQTIPERTLEEAGRWAVAFSKAWRAGLASADAFWVNADQVSKTPMSGEFVARGAWVVHGTKHFLHDLPLELALGTVHLEGEAESWTVAPQSALRARGSVRFLLTPGEERERPEREIELARATGLSRSALQSLLPAGGVNVRRA